MCCNSFLFLLSHVLQLIPVPLVTCAATHSCSSCHMCCNSFLFLLSHVLQLIPVPLVTCAATHSCSSCHMCCNSFLFLLSHVLQLIPVPLELLHRLMLPGLGPILGETLAPDQNYSGATCSAKIS